MSTNLEITLGERLAALGFIRATELITRSGNVENCPELADKGVWSQISTRRTITYVRTRDGEIWVRETDNQNTNNETAVAVLDSLGYTNTEGLASLASEIFFGDEAHPWSIICDHLNHRETNPHWRL